MFAYVGLGVLAVLTFIVNKRPISKKFTRTKKVLWITGLLIACFVLFLKVGEIENDSIAKETGISEHIKMIEVRNSPEPVEDSAIEPRADYLVSDTFGDYFIGIKKVAFKVDTDGNNVVVLIMDYAHDKKWSKKTYGWNIRTKVSQNGVTCSSNKQYSSDNHYDEIKGGVILEIIEAFTLRDNSPIDIEITPLLNLASGELAYTITNGIPFTAANVTPEPATIVVTGVSATPDLSGNVPSSYSYNAQSGEWEQVYHTIAPQNTATSTESTIGMQSSSEFTWKKALGNLYDGVDLYMGAGNEKQKFGRIAGITASDVRIYAYATEQYVWFDRQTVISSFFVRSDDPNLLSGK